jgi:hypothetical protein
MNPTESLPAVSSFDVWRRIQHTRYAPWLTHGPLMALSATLWLLLWFAPFWIVFLPGVLLAHRIGILLHESIQ